MFVQLVRHYESKDYRDKFISDCTAIRHYNTSTGEHNASALPHGEYMMSGFSLSLVEKKFLDAIITGLRLVEPNFGISSSNCGCIRTVNGMYHQPSHLDHGMFRMQDKEGQAKAFIGHIGLMPEGCLLRLDLLTDKAMMYISKGEEIPQDLALWTELKFVHVPYGAFLLINARQFHGGHYGSDDALRFHCFLSTLPWESNNKTDEICLLPRMTESGAVPPPKTATLDLKGMMEMMSTTRLSL
ncbi:unnamed protein product [Cylindrotheca closterium]|uniref:Uncharacterized protein n=1 Tax=Cylindrotheca closterium TaxID=2856 RepID=A0AAD2FRN8_9STRA|nr:unnamed protein product [Cylindrotheca closterium]